MRTLIRRVSQASVSVHSHKIGEISKGLLVYLGIHRDDKVEDIAEDMVEKVKNTLNHSDESDITAEIDPESSETKGAN